MNLRHKKKIEHTNLGLMLWHGVRSYGGVIGKTKKNGLKTGVRSYGGVIEIRRIYHFSQGTHARFDRGRSQSHDSQGVFGEMVSS